MAKVLITTTYVTISDPKGYHSPAVATSVVEVPKEVAHTIVARMNLPSKYPRIQGLTQFAEILED